MNFFPLFKKKKLPYTTKMALIDLKPKESTQDDFCLNYSEARLRENHHRVQGTITTQLVFIAGGFLCLKLHSLSLSSNICLYHLCSNIFLRSLHPPCPMSFILFHFFRDHFHGIELLLVCTMVFKRYRKAGNRPSVIGDAKLIIGS